MTVAANPFFLGMVNAFVAGEFLAESDIITSHGNSSGHYMKIISLKSHLPRHDEPFIVREQVLFLGDQPFNVATAPLFTPSSQPGGKTNGL